MIFLNDYKEAKRNDFFDQWGSEERFFWEYDIPESEWEIYRWEAGRSAREALAEREKRAADAMTVGQLIEHLKTFPQDLPAVVVWANGGYYCGINLVTIEKTLPPSYNLYDNGVMWDKTPRVEVVVLKGLT